MVKFERIISSDGNSPNLVFVSVTMVVLVGIRVLPNLTMSETDCIYIGFVRNEAVAAPSSFASVLPLTPEKKQVSVLLARAFTCRYI